MLLSYPEGSIAEPGVGFTNRFVTSLWFLMTVYRVEMEKRKKKKQSCNEAVKNPNLMGLIIITPGTGLILSHL